MHTHNDLVFRNHTLRQDLQHVNDPATVYKCSGDVFELWEYFWNRKRPLDDFCKPVSMERDGTVMTDRVSIPSTFRPLGVDARILHLTTCYRHLHETRIPKMPNLHQ